MILIDTNVFIWWLSDRDKLSSQALKSLNANYSNNQIMVSSISIWEICLLIQKKRLFIQQSKNLDTWIKGLDKLPGLDFIPINNSIAYQSTTLPGDFHKDPADRLVVATARYLDAPLVTKDLKIRRYNHVKTIW